VDAWTRCIEIERSRSPDHAERIDQQIAKEGFEKAGRDAAYSCQYAALRLRPWEWTPSWVEPNDIDAILAKQDHDSRDMRTAAVLLRKMLNAGLSRWEPDPMTALVQAKKRDATA
jgi:hypothetical protein